MGVEAGLCGLFFTIKIQKNFKLMNEPKILKVSGIVDSVEAVNGLLQIKLRSDSFTGIVITIGLDLNSSHGATIQAGDHVEVDFIERIVKVI